MTRCESVAKPWDSCTGCPSVKTEDVYGHRVELCGHPDVLAAFGRQRVAAAVARADVCRGSRHPKFPRDRT